VRYTCPADASIFTIQLTQELRHVLLLLPVDPARHRHQHELSHLKSPPDDSNQPGDADLGPMSLKTATADQTIAMGLRIGRVSNPHGHGGVYLPCF
jgi:hypothetical protein